MEQIKSKDGTTIAFRRSGSGPALLFVHGMTADHRSWTRISPYFEGHFTVYAMDRRGRGSSGDSPDYDFMHEVEDVSALVESIGKPVNVFGHSLGGLICLEAALLTDKIGSLILYEPHVPHIGQPTPPDLPDQIQALINQGKLEASMLLFLREGARMPDEEIEVYRKLPLWAGRISLAPTLPREMRIDRVFKFDARKYAKLIIPTLLLLGGDSPSFARQAVEVLESALPNSKLVVLPGQQHMAHHTNPELFAREIMSFLRE
jgi:pimeloyl-ACP methyl ester carboxylesterase